MSDQRVTPPGTTDTHLHIYEPGHAQSPHGPPPEPAATLADYRAEMARLGIDRAVVVQPSAFGTDNACTLAAIAALGPAARGVAILPEEVTDRELDLLGAQGIVGLRCLMVGAAGMMDWGRTERMAGRATERGWHLDLQFLGEELPEREAAIRALPGRMVIDHLGRLPVPADPDGPEAHVLLRLLETGRIWIKLSAPYYADQDGPDYPDATALAARLAAAAPDRCLWGSNWPHPQLEPRPDNAPLLRQVAEWAPDEATYRRILVDNPAEFYGFGDD